MKRILYIQVPPPRFSHEEFPTNIPLAAGFLASALDVSASSDVRTEILEPDVMDILADDALAAAVCERQPEAVGLTLYLWNVRRSLFLASNIKRRRPDTLIIVGGPEVTPDNEWVLNHPAIDAGIFGEGESRISAVLQALLADRRIDGIHGTFHKDRFGLHLNRKAPQAWDLNASPYPYLTGGMGPSKDGTIFVETVRGCPFRCRYCYYHKAFDRVRPHPAQSVRAALDWAYSEESGVREIYLMDPTFNAIPGFRAVLQSIAARRARKDIAIHTELRADLLSADDVELLRAAGLKTAEVGLQTTNPAALRQAGRTGDPARIAAGVNLLKAAGIQIYTGIIVGLPEDTPDGFARTLAWLRETGAYSVVQPFVLSVLPGTDFRAEASSLGLRYDPRPPYYVRETGTFPHEAFHQSLLECERVFGVELDHVPLPSLVDRGPEVIHSLDSAEYVSKWIVDPARCLRDQPGLPARVAAHATDPFVLWFRGDNTGETERAALAILRKFILKNPHALLTVVFEFPDLPHPAFMESALSEIADPGLFVNKSFAPLIGEGEVMFPRFIILIPDSDDSALPERIWGDYAPYGVLVWPLTRPPGANRSADAFPVLISLSVREVGTSVGAFLKELAERYGDQPENVLFRDPNLHEAWLRWPGRVSVKERVPERIFAAPHLLESV